MELTVNGHGIETVPGITVADFLKSQDVESPDMVSVELNEEVIPRQAYGTLVLKDNDRIEYLYFMGGGAI
ncbi:MAG: sulfur carrier protein ThiS [Proteobacteria bacterium]|nr:sulfur carrier protein ThiS [Pseudomonadota bacterium]